MRFLYVERGAKSGINRLWDEKFQSTLFIQRETPAFIFLALI